MIKDVIVTLNCSLRKDVNCHDERYTTWRELPLIKDVIVTSNCSLRKDQAVRENSDVWH